MWIFQAFRALLVEYQLTNHHILAVQMPNNGSWGEGANYTPLPPLNAALPNHCDYKHTNMVLLCHVMFVKHIYT